MTLLIAFHCSSEIDDCSWGPSVPLASVVSITGVSFGELAEAIIVVLRDR